MSTTSLNPLRKVWQVWKSLRLPWRKRLFIGQDPQGNTYYELLQPRGDTTGNRRLVHYPRSTPYSEVKVPPAWHQWLRHQRPDPPSMQEQIAELQRQARIKVLAAEADARWEAKDSLLDMPKKSVQRETAQGGAGKMRTAAGGEVSEGAREGRRREDAQKSDPDPDPDPWKRAAQRGAPGETWQPEAWAPAPAKKR